MGQTPSHLENPDSIGVLYQTSSDEFLLNVENVARFWVRHGNEIRIEPYNSAHSVAIRHFLLGAPLGALLHQRAVLSLHASSVWSPKGAALFCGPSAIGKSTLAAALSLRGFPLLSDEVCAIDSSGDAPRLHPGAPRAILWPDSLAKLGFAKAGHAKVVPGVNKREVELPLGFGSAAVPIHAVYVLGTTLGGVSIARIKGFNKVATLRDQLYRPRLLPPGTEESTMKQILGLATKSELYEVRRPRNKFRLSQLVDAIEGDLSP